MRAFTYLERDVARLCAKAETDQTIANTLGITEREVSRVIAAAQQKAAVNDRIGLALHALKQGFTSEQLVAWRSSESVVAYMLGTAEISLLECNMLDLMCAMPGFTEDTLAAMLGIAPLSVDRRLHTIFKRCGVEGEMAELRLVVYAELVTAGWRTPRLTENRLRLGGRMLDTIAGCVRGLSNPEMGKRFGISAETVGEYIERATDIFNVHTRLALTLAFMQQAVPPEERFLWCDRAGLELFKGRSHKLTADQLDILKLLIQHPDLTDGGLAKYLGGTPSNIRLQIWRITSNLRFDRMFRHCTNKRLLLGLYYWLYTESANA